MSSDFADAFKLGHTECIKRSRRLLPPLPTREKLLLYVENQVEQPTKWVDSVRRYEWCPDIVWLDSMFHYRCYLWIEEQVPADDETTKYLKAEFPRTVRLQHNVNITVPEWATNVLVVQCLYHGDPPSVVQTCLTLLRGQKLENKV